MTEDEIRKTIGFLKMPKEKQEEWLKYAETYLFHLAESRRLLAGCSGCDCVTKDDLQRYEAYKEISVSNW